MTTPLPCPQPNCTGHIRAYYDGEYGPQPNLSVAIVGIYDDEESDSPMSGANLSDDWRIEGEVDTEWVGWMDLKCSECGTKYEPEQLATLYPDRYTPTPEDAAHD